ncbi:MAG: glycosyltransferase [Myxococcota bacterium]|nr:glycosyltransferase [Myxococcota bacterium]
MTPTAGVVIPARDEAHTVGDAVRTARRALRRAGLGWAPVVVVADGCADDTAAVAAEAGALVVETRAGCVGAARAAGARALLSTLGADPARTWIASTDADTRVPVRWIERHLDAARAGVHALAGVVRVGSFSEHPEGARARFAARYELRSDGTHPHVHGANLGVRADAYLAVGGFPALPVAEDHALWRALGEAGFRRQASTRVWVTTSGRRRGRAPRGFATTLSQWTGAAG